MPAEIVEYVGLSRVAAQLIGRNWVQMDSDTFNWLAMAVLSALLLVFGMPVALEVYEGGHGGKHSAQAAYKLPEAEATATAGTAAPAAKKGFDFKQVAALFGEASPEKGAAVFKKCASCHTVNEGGKNGQGPNLYNIVGRGLGSVEGYKYSKAMSGKGGVWDYESLAAFIYKPKDWLKGTKMAFAGLRKEKDLANLMAYLGSLSATPKPLPAAQ